MRLWERQNLLFDLLVTTVAVGTGSVEVTPVGSLYIRYRSVVEIGGWRHCCFGLVIDDGLSHFRETWSSAFSNSLDIRYKLSKRVSKASLARKPVSWWVTSVNCWCRWERVLRIVFRTGTGWLPRNFCCKDFSVFSNNRSSCRKRLSNVCSFSFPILVVEIGAKKLSAWMHCG